MKKEMGYSISHERIYQYLFSDKQAGGSLHQHLRCRKKRKKRYGSNDRRGQLKNRVSIDRRPSVVNDRSRRGDWPARPPVAGGEVDTMIGKRHKQALVSLAERKSRLSLIYKVERRTKEEVAAAIWKSLGPMRALVHTLTADNGKEFAEHERLANNLKPSFILPIRMRLMNKG